MLGYEWDFSITLSDFLVGISSVIGAFAIVGAGIRWLGSKLNSNTTIIKSVQPYLRIGKEKNYYPLKSQHEFSQFIRDVPLDILQITSIAYFVHFDSINKNENKVIYQSYCKCRFGLKWFFQVIKENSDRFSKKTDKISRYLRNTKRYEDFIFKDSKDDASDKLHKLECEYALIISSLILFKDILIKVKIENSDKSKTSWCECKLIIEDESIETIIKKVPVFNTEEEMNQWIQEWQEKFYNDNDDKFDFDSKI